MRPYGTLLALALLSACSGSSDAEDAQSDTAQNDTAQGDTAQSDTAQSDTAQSDTAQSGDAEGDTGDDVADVGVDPDHDADTSVGDTDDESDASPDATDAEELDAEEIDTGATDATDADISDADATDADATDADTMEGDTGTPPDADADAADASEADADTGEPTCDDGYEFNGVECENVNECLELLDDCDLLVECVDTPGGFECGDCPLGYEDKFGDGTKCESLFEAPPVGAPQCYLWGTSHLRSFDGLVYDIQGAGEWRLAFVEDEAGFEVQVRQEPHFGDFASRVTRVAVLVGEQRVELSLGSTDPVIDGVSTEVPPEGIPLDGASLHLVDGAVVVAWTSRTQVRLHNVGTHIDAEIYLAPTQLGRTLGLCADSDGVAAYDIILPGGESLIPPVDVQALYSSFVHAWRVDVETSLFTYGEGQGSETYFDADFPTFYTEASDLEPAVRDLYVDDCLEAELGHPFLVEACILDAYVLDMESALAGARRVLDPELILALDKPLLFLGWTQEGPLSNGNWNVAADFRSLRQTVNGDPTMFVSPNSYLNARIEGTIKVDTTSDDDIVGFVFGHRSPVASTGDTPYEFDTFLFDWKQSDQVFGGLMSYEGFTLARVNGTFDSGWNTFWQRSEDADGWTVIETLYGSDKGWADNAVNDFVLLHLPHRVDIWMNGTLVIRAMGEFQSGRFGFYNYSQQNVVYADFRVIDIDAAALCGDGVLDPGEACDDGNHDNGDGCSAQCEDE